MGFVDIPINNLIKYSEPMKYNQELPIINY